VAKPGLAAAQPAATKPPPKVASGGPKATPKKSVDKPVGTAAKAVTKPAWIAKADPLAPLPAKHPGHSKDFASAR